MTYNNQTNVKYRELENQLNGLKIVIDKVEKAIKDDSSLRIGIEMSYFDEKSRRSLSEMKYIYEDSK